MTSSCLDSRIATSLFDVFSVCPFYGPLVHKIAGAVQECTLVMWYLLVSASFSCREVL